MNTYLFKKARSIFQKYPWVYDIAAKLFVNVYYKTEIALIKGNHQNNNHHQSVIHFTHNKSASMHVKRILDSLAYHNGMTPVHLNDYSFNTGYPYISSLEESDQNLIKNIFKPNGYVYSAFGGPVKALKNLSDFKLIYMIRDPRDILVSDFYSKKASHLIPPSINMESKQRFTELRTDLDTKDINEYVLENKVKVLTQFNNYLEYFEGCNVLLVKYEEMITDYYNWLKNIFELFDINHKSKLFEEKILEDSEKNKEKKSADKYIRSGTWGDFKNKLTKETIDILNVEFKNILDHYQYER